MVAADDSGPRIEAYWCIQKINKGTIVNRFTYALITASLLAALTQSPLVEAQDSPAGSTTLQGRCSSRPV